MRLTEVGLAHFRNLATASLEVPSSGAVLVGANGQGKTNFLEALHYLAQFRSFRGASHRDAIAFDADHFRVEGGVRYGDGRSRTVAVAADREVRRVAVDGHQASRAAEAIGTVVAVLFAPGDLTIVTGPPVGRRRLLDSILAVASRRYGRALQEYDRVLRQRNGLLRGPARGADAMLEPWDVTLVAAGTPIVVARAALVRRLAARFAEVGEGIADAGEQNCFALAYRPSIRIADGEAEDPARVESAWREALEARRERDRAWGWTTVGPHRDDIVVRLAGRPLAKFGSQGEQRTAAIALRLLEAEILEADTGHRPILLLDDVFSELDASRAERLAERLGERCQRFVTSPRPLSWLDGSLAHWRVEAGRIDRTTAA